MAAEFEVDDKLIAGYENLRKLSEEQYHELIFSKGIEKYSKIKDIFGEDMAIVSFIEPENGEYVIGLSPLRFMLRPAKLQHDSI